MDSRTRSNEPTHVVLQVPLLASVLTSNHRQVEHAIDRIIETGRKKVGLLGFSFKADTDDLRESPMVILAEALLGKGYTLKIYDRNVSLARLVGANKQYIEEQIPHLSRHLSESIDQVIEQIEKQLNKLVNVIRVTDFTNTEHVERELLPMARDMKIVIAVEEVWNKFLLSPLEFARYVDEFESPWVRAYFDVGNVVLYGFPQDWIRTLGSRIVKVHLKDFSLDRKTSQYAWKNIGEGDIDWPQVRKAFGEIGYAGYVTTEVRGGDAAYLKDLSQRIDRFLAGERPFTPPTPTR